MVLKLKLLPIIFRTGVKILILLFGCQQNIYLAIITLIAAVFTFLFYTFSSFFRFYFGTIVVKTTICIKVSAGAAGLDSLFCNFGKKFSVKDLWRSRYFQFKLHLLVLFRYSDGQKVYDKPLNVYGIK